MAEEALVTTEPLVQPLTRFLQELETEKGATSFCILHKDPGTPEDQWNLLFAANWVKGMGRGQALTYLAQKLYREIEEELRKRIARIVVLDEEEPFVRMVSSAFHVRLGVVGTTLVNCYAGPFHIERAIILVTARAKNEPASR
jgi:hypothetical protein